MAFVKIPAGQGYAYFQEGAQGLEAISNPQTLRGLASGSIQATEQPTIAGGANRFSAIPQQTTRTLDGFQSTPPAVAPARSLGTVGDFQGGTQSPQQPPLSERLMNMLLEAQRIGTSKFKTASLNLQEQQADRVFQTSPGLIGASPSQQAQVRNASVSAIQPSINAADQLGQTFGEQLQGFGDQVKTVQSYLKQESDRQNQEREQAQNDIYNAITAFGPRFNEVVGKDVLKLAGWTNEAVTAAKEKLTSQELFKQRGEGFTLGEGEVRYADDGSVLAKGPPKTFAPKEGGGSAGGVASNRGARIIDAVDELLPKVSINTVGLQGYLKAHIPGTDAFDFASDLDTLKANIAFNELQEMRDASKTGGALGSIAVQELNLLEATLGSLNQGQSPENFIKNLNKIKTSVQNWERAMQQTSGGAGSQNTDPLEIR